MAYSHVNTGAVREGFFATLKADLGAWRARRRVYAKTLTELSRLSNRELADLGLHRSQLRSVALQAANEQ